MKERFQALRAKCRGMPKVRKIVIGILGGSVLLFGVVLIVLPGPSSIVIPAGIAILATEFAWARRVLKRGRILVQKARRSVETATNRLPAKIS